MGNNKLTDWVCHNCGAINVKSKNGYWKDDKCKVCFIPRDKQWFFHSGSLAEPYVIRDYRLPKS